ncbi:hypothetical protein F511_30837 [Dorcoceras hygrometricum]|uniref:Uncharacterized protein n=1 Tax=Dorcoceras hygrometricum TaxID=472368 RepID=A0A2Z7AKB6_9LAMI|nr:hypothetical protein F511_30837 [Dorcoceras hygrometricum]
MVKRLATSPHDPLGITDSSCKNQLVVVSVQYGPFNTYIPIRSTTIGKSRVARDPIAMHTSWRSNSDIVSVTSIGYPRMRASGESSTTKHRLLHASGSHPIPMPNDPKTNQYNQDLGHIHSTNGNHLESPNEGSIDHQVTIHLHAQNITIFPNNETWYFASQVLVSISGYLILILTAQSTRNEFRIHNSSDEGESGSVGLLLLRRFVWWCFTDVCLKLVVDLRHCGNLLVVIVAQRIESTRPDTYDSHDSLRCPLQLMVPTTADDGHLNLWWSSQLAVVTSTRGGHFSLRLMQGKHLTT